ncbi:MAG: N-acetylmuramoyl-L-alanine amidase [Pseudomonadota bacterium]
MRGARRFHLAVLVGVVLLGAVPGAATAQKVYLNPSNQTANILCAGGNEATYALICANKAEDILDAAGFNSVVDQDFYNAPSNANSWGAAIFVSMHTNAGGGHGTETLYKTNADKALAGDVQAGLLANLPYQSRGLKYRDNLHVLNATNMTACLEEALFHDCCTSSGYTGHPPSESSFLKTGSGQNAIAAGVAEGVCAYFNSTCTGGGPTTGTLMGVVYLVPNLDDRIPGATVTLNTGQSTTANGVGYWEFELPPGTYTATASKAGYVSGSNTKAVTAGAEIWGSIGLTQCNCNDGNPCTNDACVGGVCTHTNNTSNCNDGSACTSGDKCSGGTCQGTDSSGTCDDGNPCTNDGCAPASGCTHANNSSNCNDGNACTTGDKCSGGSCHGTDISGTCDDGNPCTDDLCQPAAGCVHPPNTAVCNDANACTGPDHCAGGVCQGADVAAACEDGNPCTDDWCDPGVGCQSLVNNAPCDDGDSCTAGDLCVGGVCVGNDLSWICKDGNPCTDDLCDPAGGCMYVPNVATCDDGDACTQTDLCASGICVGSGAPACDDGNSCTDDSCAAALGCVHAPNGLGCDDGDVCTGVDVCAGSACVGVDTSSVDCDDGDPCTDDGCAPLTGCTHVPGVGPCDDGDPCTTGDLCAAGICVGGSTDDEACDDGNPCTTDSCSSPAGCVHEPIGGACDDGDPCTFGDHCVAGLCQGSGAKTCVDGNPCTDDSCDPQVGCVFSANAAPCDDGDPCTSADLCVGGACDGADVPCDDENPCTKDLCDRATGDCLFVPTAGVCDDDDPCTETVCLGGECVVQALEAGCCADHTDCESPGEACDPVDKSCVEVHCAPCEDDGDCGIHGNRCLLLDGVRRCVIGCGGGPGICSEAAPCTFSAGGGWVCLPAPGACDAPGVDGDGVVLGDAAGPSDAGDGGELVTGSAGPSGGCVVGVHPAGRAGAALLLLFLSLILRLFAAPRARGAAARRTWRSTW